MSVATSPADLPAAPTPQRWQWFVLAGILTLLFLVPKLFQHAAAHTGDLDTGNYSHFAWSIAHGQPLVAVHGRHHFGEHCSPIMFLIAPLYWLWSSAYVLMTLQAAAVIAAALLALDFGEKRLRDAGLAGPGRPDWRLLSGGVLTVLYLLYPPLLATWKTQFQPIELGMPLVVLAILLLHARRDAWLAVVVTLLLMTRESAPLAVAGLAFYAAACLGRYRVAIYLTLAGSAWAYAAFAVVMPYFREVSSLRHLRYVAWGELWDVKWKYLVILFLGTGLLGFCGRAAAVASLAAVPGVLLNLSVGAVREGQVSFENHYDAEIAPFLMIAAASGATWLLARPLAAKTKASLLLAALVVGGFVSGMLSVKGPVQAYHDWWPTKDRLAFAKEARALGRKYADAPALAGWNVIGPQVCHRPNYQTIRVGKSPEEYQFWAAARLLPGTILLVPRESFSPENFTRQLLRDGGRARRVEVGEQIEVWQWPPDAPPPGTPEAERYVKNLPDPATKPTTTRRKRPARRPTTTARATNVLR